MDEIDRLFELTDAAQSCNACAWQFIDDFCTVPEWTHVGRGILCQPTADSQAKAWGEVVALNWSFLTEQMRRWKAVSVAMRRIQHAAATLPNWPVFEVGDRTFDTAHEAAHAAAELVCSSFRQAEGMADRDWISDLANKLSCLTLRDLSGYIEREYQTAIGLLPEESEPTDSPPAAVPQSAFAEVLTPDEQRAKFCFEQWQDGKSLKEINLALRQSALWDAFEDVRSVRGPIQVWAHRIGVIPRKGQPGRKAASE